MKNKNKQFEKGLHKIVMKYLERSFICEDKSIHFGKLHVNYVRDFQEMSDDVTKLYFKLHGVKRASTDKSRPTIL